MGPRCGCPSPACRTESLSGRTNRDSNPMALTKNPALHPLDPTAGTCLPGSERGRGSEGERVRERERVRG